jgi:UDP-N-acetylglucosamine--N-acetylmuramyl-(pentapeptide) pyrophosphoryl-undecaprenol N-acetylglucosamine transferase
MSGSSNPIKRTPSAPQVFLVAGLTGGPFFPLPWYAKTLTEILGSETQVHYLGVKGSFEEKRAATDNLSLITLPSVKLSILSFKKQKPSELIKNILELIGSLFMLQYSILRCLYLLVKYRPRAIVTTGSFLAVPLVIARNFLKFFGLKTKLIVHQQDPLPGLSNKYSARYSDVLSCVFSYTQEHFTVFKDAQIIPNPLQKEVYDTSQSQDLKLLERVNVKLYQWLKKDTLKPLLFLFGGGSGSQDLNRWLYRNHDELIKAVRIVHLTGLLQNDDTPEESTDYFTQKAFLKEMIPMLKRSDMVMCRAGLGSISELRYLQKTGLLVPLPHSHQELNAELVNDEFTILKQSEMETWVETIEKVAKELETENSKENQYLQGLDKYRDALQKTLGR